MEAGGFKSELFLGSPRLMVGGLSRSQTHGISRPVLALRGGKLPCCNVCNVNNVCIPTRGVLFLCFHDQYMVCSVLIEPKMSSGGHRAAEKSSS